MKYRIVTLDYVNKEAFVVLYRNGKVIAELKWISFGELRVAEALASLNG